MQWCLDNFKITVKCLILWVKRDQTQTQLQQRRFVSHTNFFTSCRLRIVGVSYVSRFSFRGTRCSPSIFRVAHTLLRFCIALVHQQDLIVVVGFVCSVHCACFLKKIHHHDNRSDQRSRGTGGYRQRSTTVLLERRSQQYCCWLSSCTTRPKTSGKARKDLHHQQRASEPRQQ